MQVITEDRMALFAEMESKYEQKDTEYFVSLLEHQIMLLEQGLHVF